MSSLETVNLGGFCSHENTPEGPTGAHKSSFLQYKQVSVRNGDPEWLRTTNAFIVCDLFWKVQKGHATNREGSFNYYMTYENVTHINYNTCTTLSPSS